MGTLHPLVRNSRRMRKMYVVPAEGEQPEEDLTSRSDVRRARKVREDATLQLAKDLVELPVAALARLEVTESVAEALAIARGITSPRARERQLRLVRNLLRDGPWTELRVRLDHLLVHGTVPSAATVSERGVVEVWVIRLLGEGTPALDELIASHPNADRQHLRQLVRAAHGATGGGDRRKRAEEKLARAVRSLL